MITAAELIELKGKVKQEMARRSGSGSLATYATATWDFTTTPAKGGTILAEQGKKVIEPLLAIKQYGNLKSVVQNDLIPSDFDNTKLVTIVNSLAAESTTSSSTSCNSACSGLCKGQCYSACSSCTGSCSGSCGGCDISCGDGCKTSCGSCGGCTGSCGGCGGCDYACTTTCKNSCKGCSSCTGSCYTGCSGCGGDCSSECARNCGGCTEGCWAACKSSSKPTIIPPFIVNANSNLLERGIDMQNTETKVIAVDEKLSSYIESLQYEINARKELLLAMMNPSISSQVDKADFEAYHKEYVECVTKYEAAKSQLEKTYIKPQFPDVVNWSLDFETRELTVACAKKA